MTDGQKLVAIKLLHTVVWGFFASLIFYTLYCGLFDRVSYLTWWAIGLVLLEAFVLLFNHWYCPLTIVARRYSDSERDNFDIFLPEWLARHNKWIFSILFGLGVLLVLLRSLDIDWHAQD